jgi:hypothetical protein
MTRLPSTCSPWQIGLGREQAAGSTSATASMQWLGEVAAHSSALAALLPLTPTENEMRHDEATASEDGEGRGRCLGGRRPLLVLALNRLSRAGSLHAVVAESRRFHLVLLVLQQLWVSGVRMCQWFHSCGVLWWCTKVSRPHQQELFALPAQLPCPRPPARTITPRRIETAPFSLPASVRLVPNWVSRCARSRWSTAGVSEETLLDGSQHKAIMPGKRKRDSKVDLYHDATEHRRRRREDRLLYRDSSRRRHRGSRGRRRRARSSSSSSWSSSSRVDRRRRSGVHARAPMAQRRDGSCVPEKLGTPGQ